MRQGQSIDRIAGVASFFVSRIDTAIDKKVDELGSDEAKAIRGKVAIANAKLAYQWYLDFLKTDRWQALAAKGAHAAAAAVGVHRAPRTRPIPTRCTSTR